MMHVDDLKRVVAQEIDRRGEELVRVAQAIVQHPEPGFREVRTAALVHQKLSEMGVQHRTGIAVTGLKGYLEGGAGPGPTVGVMGSWTRLSCWDTRRRTRRRRRRTRAAIMRRSA